MITLHDKQFIPFISKEAIQKRITELALQIEKDNNGSNPLFVVVLNGAFVFAADLLRNMNISSEVAFVQLSSYSGMASSGNVQTHLDITQQVAGRHIIIIEDIIDTGRTLNSFLNDIKKMQPLSVKIATLLLKPSALQHYIQADYIGFEIPVKFVVGYGMDYNGLGRNLQEIYVIADQ